MGMHRKRSVRNLTDDDDKSLFDSSVDVPLRLSSAGWTRLRQQPRSSIAAHRLYEECHPQLQFYPTGILVMGDGILRQGQQPVRALGKPWPSVERPNISA